MNVDVTVASEGYSAESGHNGIVAPEASRLEDSYLPLIADEIEDRVETGVLLNEVERGCW